jgi:ABC-type transport system substrate-binding protein
MRRFVWLWLAASSLALAARVSSAETRPQYGGRLRIAIREEITSLDPGDSTQADSLARRNVLGLIFETLVTVDDRGRIHPALATGWQAEPGNQRWQFEIRHVVKFHDGSELTPELAAATLRAQNPSWRVLAQGDSVVVESALPDPDLPAELALTRNGIAKKNGAGTISGTGPFRIENWQPGKQLRLAAEENHWRGRAFVDSIEIEMGKNFREQLLELDSDQADIVEVAPEQTQRVLMQGHRVSGSQPIELLALVFADEPRTAEDKMLRSALAHSIERGSMRSVLLQGAGEPAASLLPTWMSGYGFAFSTETDLKRAREERAELRAAAPTLTVGYDANDPLARTIVERVALNAQDAGLMLRPVASASADLRLRRVPLASTDPWVALENVAEVLGLAMPHTAGDSIEDLFAAEQALLAKQRVIPLLHLPAEWALSPGVKDWRVGTDGSWRLNEVSMGKGRP